MQLQLSFISFVFIKMNNKEPIFKEYSIKIILNLLLITITKLKILEIVVYLLLEITRI